MNAKTRRFLWLAPLWMIAGIASSAAVGSLALYGQDPGRGTFKLPPARALFSPPSDPGAFPKVIRGIPLSLDGIGTAWIADGAVLWIPVLMYEPKLPVRIDALSMDPMNWPDQKILSRDWGRRSLYFVDKGKTMLYAVAIDPGNLTPQAIGVGLVLVKRVDDTTYDVRIESYGGDVLAAARGTLQELDPSIGMGTLRPIANQKEIRMQYGASWDLDPNQHAFPLFSR